MSLQAGHKLAHYEILEPIGKGGMGEVYLADDTKLKREVAIKVLPESLRDDPERLRLFRREAEAAARLNHPAIATIHALEDAADTTFIVMERVEGHTLSSEITRGGMPLDRFFAVFIPLAEGLAHAHAAGRVHRDLKPGNVMIDASGAPKILDFGLAYIADADLDPDVDADVSSDSPTLLRPIDDASALVGTPSYMSPEQIERTGVDPRSDLFSFGVMMYEALTGKPPFEGQSVSSLLARILEAEPRPVTELKPDSTNQLWWIIRGCLRKRREERLQSATELAANLSDAQRSVGDTSPAASSATGRASWAYAVGALVIGMAVAWLLKPVPAQDVPHRKFVYEIAPYASTVAALVESAAISPDGTMLAYNDVSGGTTALWVRELSSVTPRELPDTRGAMAPFWSPDNRHVGFFLSGTPATLNRVSVDGGTDTVLCDLPDRRPRGAVWLADGTIIFGVRGDDEQTGGTLYAISDQGGEPTVFAEGDREADQRGLMFPSVLPDGETLVLAATAGEDGGALIVDGDVVYSDPLERLAYPVYSSSGHIVFQRGFVASKGVWAIGFDLARRQTIGEPFLIEAEGGSPTLAADGTLVYGSSAQFEDLPGQLVWVDRQGNVERIDEVRSGLGTPALSPSGRLVAFDAIQNDNRDVFVFDIERDQLARLTFDRERDRFPVWSRDGRLLAFQSFRSGGGDIYAVPADGSSDEVLLVDGRRNDTPNTWSMDGSYLIYTYFADDTAQDLMLAPVDSEGSVQPAGDTRPLLQTRRNEGWGDVSPDGRYIVYDSNESGQFEIYVTPFPDAGRRWQVSSDGGSWPRWSPTGADIYYIGGGVATGYGPMMRVPSRSSSDFEADPAEVLFEGPEGVNFTWFSITPDATRFLAVEKQSGQTPMVTLTLVQNWARAFED